MTDVSTTCAVVVNDSCAQTFNNYDPIERRSLFLVYLLIFFFACSQRINKQSLIVPFFTRKVSTAISIEGG